MKNTGKIFWVGMLIVLFCSQSGWAAIEDTAGTNQTAAEAAGTEVAGTAPESTAAVAVSPAAQQPASTETVPSLPPDTGLVSAETAGTAAAQEKAVVPSPAPAGSAVATEPDIKSVILDAASSAAVPTSPVPPDTASAGTVQAAPASADVANISLPPTAGRKFQYITLSKPGKDVFVRSSNGQWIPASDGMVILPGDEVRTAEGSSVEVILEGEKVGHIEVKGGSQLKIAAASLDPVTGDKQTLLDLAVGKILVKAQKLTGDSQFEVHTPSAMAGVRGTLFEVEVAGKLEPMD